MDTNFLYGQQYWYIVKAVFQDGSISSSSNTTQIIIPPKKEGAIIVSLDKPAGASYFIVSPLNIHFQSTLAGKVSVSCQSGPLQVTLKESFITSGTRYSWTPILPELPDSKCMCTVSFESEGGYRDSRTFYFFCKPQLKGASVIRGTIRNQYSQEPVAGAIVQVSDGPTFASTTSQSDGTFTFKHMAHGSYTFSVEKNGFFFSFAADSIENSENVLSPWNIPLQESYQLLVWNEEPKVETNTIPLWFYTETEGYFSIYWRKDQIERTIYQQIEAYKQSTNHLQIPIANDIPSGTIQLIIENQTTNEKRDLFITLPDSLHTNYVTGFVKDYDGNPLSKAHVNEFAVNEWGYFRIPPDSLSEPIIVSAPFYEQKELSQEDVDTISTT